MEAFMNIESRHLARAGAMASSRRKEFCLRFRSVLLPSSWESQGAGRRNISLSPRWQAVSSAPFRALRRSPALNLCPSIWRQTAY
jgi:hypothetical protein